jgi:hypothetical protein
MHQSFGNVGDLDDKLLGASETLVSEVYAGCLCIGCVCIEGIRGLTVYRERIVDTIMEIYVLPGAKLLDDEAGSRSAFYGLRSITETLVWLHYCLDGYYYLMCCEFLGHSWYGFYDMVQFG